MHADVRIEQHMKLLQKFSWQVMRRLQRTGTVTTEFDDIFQQCAEAWCKARDSWSPEHGVPFVAYLKKGMVDHVNRYAGKEIFHYNGSHFELDAALPGDDTEGHELIADRSSTPEDDAIAADRREKALAKLSTRARQFVELCESPPKCLVDTVAALQARRKFAIERGQTAAHVPKRVLTGMIFRFMGCSRLEQRGICKELEEKFKISAALAAMDGVN